jgi:glycosyltransferase involved in cell wall biosynthesis
MEIIHIVLGKANPERMNGVNKVVHQLATMQTLKGRVVEVWGITPDPRPNFPPRDFKTRLFQARNNPFRLDDRLKAALTVRKGQAVFHVHGGWIPTFWALTRFLDAMDIPYVFTPHGAYNAVAMARSAWKKRIYFQLFEQHVLLRARQIHCIGQSEVEGLNRLLPGIDSSLVPYGLDFATTTLPAAPADGPFVVGFMGRLDIHTKGLDLLLPAFAAFQREQPKAELWIMGDGSEAGRLAAMVASLGLQDCVKLLGSKFGEEKLAGMRRMHVFVHPSRNEGLPSAVLEAASMGIPSIVSQATNLGSYVQEYAAGLVIPNADVAALTAALRQLHQQWQSPHGLSAMRAQAQRMVRTAFDWQRLVLEFDQLYARA